MKPLKVLIEISGEKIHAGTLFAGDVGAYVFAYDKTYLSRDWARPISLQLPLETKEFSPEVTRNFFEGLLPEGFTRRTLADAFHVDETDYISLLKIMGRECIGAIQIVDDSADLPKNDYEKLTDGEIKKLAKEGAKKTVEIIAKTRLSLAGATGKVGLYCDGKNWFLPKGDAPSTHIVKQSHVRLDGIVLNEHYVMTLAGLLGIDAVKSFIINTGQGNDEEVLYATKRYDRYFSENSIKIRGKERPARLHQEDFAQAMGVPSSGKYEKPGQHFLKDMCDVLRTKSISPMEDIIKLVDLTIFNYLIGNTDNHIKNHSLIYSPDLGSVRLAPAYDLICTCIYDGNSREMAFSIDGKHLIDEINADAFINEADRLSLGKNMIADRFNNMANRFEQAMDEACKIIKGEGFKEVTALKKKILKSGTGKRISG